jgi:hypothetical protein
VNRACSSHTVAAHRNGGYVRLFRLTIVAVVLLAQFELLWLSAFHHHNEPLIGQGSLVVCSSSDGQHGRPSDTLTPCTLCRVIRHSIGSPAAITPPVFHPICISEITLPRQAKPFAAATFRLSERSPPLSS